MTKERSTSIWPLLLIAALFALGVCAPRFWERKVSSRSYPITAHRAAVASKRVQRPAPRPVQIAERIAPPQTKVEVPAAPQVSDNLDLSAFAQPREVATIAGPISRRVGFDLFQPQLFPQSTTTLVRRTNPLLPERALHTRRPRTLRPRTAMSAPVEIAQIEHAPTWPEPANLILQLDRVAQTASCADWASEVVDRILDLCQHESVGSARSSALLIQLKELSQSPPHQAVPAETRVWLAQAKYGLQRRIHIWRALQRLATLDPLTLAGPDDYVSNERILADIQAVRRFLGTDATNQTWRQYLLLDQLEGFARNNDGITIGRSQTVRRVLDRFEAYQLNRRQRQFLNQTVFITLANDLKGWVNEHIDATQIAESLEQFERKADPTSSRQLADVLAQIRWSKLSANQLLSSQLELHYRNANLRLSIADSLLNRMLPTTAPTRTPVDEEILGAQVSGQSKVLTQLRVQMHPSRAYWKIGLNAVGKVSSTTETRRRPVTFFNEGSARYQAEKILKVDRLGVITTSTQADADSHSDLTGLKTEYDDIPVINLLVRSIARRHYELRSDEAQSLLNSRVADEARTRMDAEVHKQLQDMEGQFQNRFLEPMERLELNPIALDMNTTNRRAIVRYRLAGNRQLGANTPRPQAPGDSLLSFQIHQSALNNVLQQLKLDGRRSDVRKLYAEIAHAFLPVDAEPVVVPKDIPQGVSIRFDSREAIRVDCHDDSVLVTLRIKSLAAERRVWRDFVVRATFVPEQNGLNATLRRTTSVSIERRSSRLRNVVALRAIFSKVFSRSRPLSLLGTELAKNEKLDDLQVNQLVIRDGWIGTAIGPRRRRPRVAIRVTDRAE